MSLVDPSEPVPLQGGYNFRDLGGYSTTSGARVLRGLVYRSGVMTGLTDTDHAVLRGLKLKAICDLRGPDERALYPTPSEQVGVTDYRWTEHAAVSGDLKALLTRSGITPADIVAMMVDLYRQLPFDHADVFRSTMLAIGEGATPLVFHCSVGKDRTGVLSALILSALGVPWGAVLEDYLLTNIVADHRRSIFFQKGATPGFNLVPEALLEPLLKADSRYLEASFDEIGKRAGGVEGYLRDVLLLSDATMAVFRATLLDPASA